VNFENKNLLILVLFLVLTLPRIFLSVNQIIDPFAYSTAALSELYSKQGSVTIQPFNFISAWSSHANGISSRIIPSLLLTVLNIVTSISLDNLPYLPITGIIFLFLSYVFGKVFSKSNLVAVIYVSLMAFDINTIRATNITFYITLGFSFLLVFMIIFLKMLESSSRKYILLLFFCFLALYLTYYSAEFFAMAFTGSFAALIAIERLKRSKTMLSKRIDCSCSTLLWFSALFIIFFFGFDTATSDFLKISNYLTPEPSSLSVSFGGLVPAMNFVLTYSYIILLLVPVVAFFLLHLIPKLRTKFIISKNVPTSLFISLVFACVAYSLIYVFFGLSIFSRVFYIFFPLMAIFFSLQLKISFRTRFAKPALTIFFILLISTTLLTSTAFLFDPEHPYNPNGKSQMSASMSFLVDCVGNNEISKVLSSLDISGQLFYAAVKADKTNIQPFEFGKDVSILYSDDPSISNTVFHDKGYDLLVLSKSFENRAIFADGWLWTKMAPNASSFVGANPSFNKAYDDSRATIFSYIK
jgi:hypothetical protein